MHNLGLDHNRVPFFICVGSTLHNYDCAAPLLGTALKNSGFYSLGTTNNPIHANNIDKYVGTIEELMTGINRSIYQVIGVDASINMKSKEPYEYHYVPLRPGIGVGKDLPPIGEHSIHINVMRNHNKFKKLMFFINSYSKKALLDTFEAVNALHEDIITKWYHSLSEEEMMRYRTALVCEALIAQGMYYDDIAEKFNIAKGSVHNYAIKYNKNVRLKAAAQKAAKDNQRFKKTI